MALLTLVLSLSTLSSVVIAAVPVAPNLSHAARHGSHNVTTWPNIGPLEGAISSCPFSNGAPANQDDCAIICGSFGNTSAIDTILLPQQVLEKTVGECTLKITNTDACGEMSLTGGYISTMCSTLKHCIDSGADASYSDLIYSLGLVLGRNVTLLQFETTRKGC